MPFSELYRLVVEPFMDALEEFRLFSPSRNPTATIQYDGWPLQLHQVQYRVYPCGVGMSENWHDPRMRRHSTAVDATGLMHEVDARDGKIG